MDGFDGNGNIISYLDLKSMNISESNNKMWSIDNDTIDYLNEFYYYATHKWLIVYISYLALFDKQYSICQEEIENIDKLLKEYSIIPVILNPSDYTYSSKKSI